MSYLEKLLQGAEVEWKALGEVCDYEQPTKYLVQSNNYNDKFKTPVLTAGKTFILGNTDETDGIYEASKKPVIIFDDFTTDTKFVDFPFKVKSSAMKFLKAVDEKEIDLKYAFEKIQTIKITETGGDHKRRWISEYSKIEVLLPEFTEQTTIANILTKVDQAIANTEALITKYTKIKTGLMQDLLTKGIDENGNIRTEQTHEFKDSPLGSIPKEWECVLIDELANLKSGGTPSRQNSSFWNGDIPWVKTGEVNYNFIKETEEYITQKGLKMSSTVLFPKGTILMALYGQGKTRGRVSILDIDATTNQACVGFLNLKKVTTNFLYVTLTNEYEKLRDLSNDGAQKNLSSSLLKKYFLKIPSDIKEQERIDELFARIDNSIMKEQHSLTKLQSLKTGLMQDLLSGKVRVKVSEPLIIND